MWEKFSIDVYYGERGFYIATRWPRETMGYVQQNTYGPMTSDEALSLLADLPVPYVVAQTQGSLF